MTRTRESGQNEITDEAKREAARTGKHVCAVLAQMLKKARKGRDKAQRKKIEAAQKYLGCRNRRKRRKQS